MKYRVVPHTSGTNDRFEFALLDPNGLVVARSAFEKPLTMKRDELQAAFDLGVAIAKKGTECHG